MIPVHREPVREERIAELPHIWALSGFPECAGLIMSRAVPYDMRVGRQQIAMNTLYPPDKGTICYAQFVLALCQPVAAAIVCSVVPGVISNVCFVCEV